MNSQTAGARGSRWPRPVVVCAAAAVHACLAAAFGEWNELTWEREVAGARPKSWEPTGKFRQLHVPRGVTLRQIQNRLPSASVTHWIHHPLWLLLAKEKADYQTVDIALESVDGPSRKLIWDFECQPFTDRSRLRTPPTLELLHALWEVGDEHALTAMVALTLEARAARQASFMRYGAEGIWNILPRVLAKSLPLHAGWPALLSILSQRIWACPENVSVFYKWVPIDVDKLSEQLWGLRLDGDVASVAPPRRYLEYVYRQTSKIIA